MQHSRIVANTALGPMLSSLFDNGAIVYESYSEFDHQLRSFTAVDSLLEYVRVKRAADINTIQLGIYCPDTRGFLERRTINLKPEKTGGAVSRETIGGWGLIQFLLNFRSDGNAECTISVNSEKRAKAWFLNLPEMGDPELWDWRLVEKHSKRLIRILRALPFPESSAA